jgi:hypothetical protein
MTKSVKQLIESINVEFWDTTNISNSEFLQEFTGDKIDLKKIQIPINATLNKIRKLIKKIKKENFQKKIDTILEESEVKLGKLFKAFKKKNKGESIDFVEIIKDGEMIMSQNPADIKTVFLDYWSNLFKSKGPNLKLENSWFSKPKISEESKSNSTKPFSMEEMKHIIKYLRNNKAPGLDGISSEILKNLDDEFLSHLLGLFNKCLELGHIPKMWKYGAIRLLYKDGAPSQPQNYRPITLLSIPYKIFCVMINFRLTSFLESNNLISPQQNGFRNGKQTTDHLIALINIIEDAKIGDKPIHRL